MAIHGHPGGGIYALTTTEQVLDLSVFDGYEVSMSVGVDWLFCFAPDGTVAPQLLLTSPPVAASHSALVGDPVGGTIKAIRFVMNKYSMLVAKVISGTGTLVVKPTGRV